jgi:hypothetical protein
MDLIDEKNLIDEKKLIDGGKAIDSGGFGCIFLPSLKCKNSVQNNSFISKLMLNKDSDDEYNLIQKFEQKLKSIPNYKNYFLLGDIQICHPSQLTSDDLVNYDKKCDTLIEQGIKSSNINLNLDKIKTINMPFGGINVKKFMKNNFNSIDLIKLNNSLIKLLQNGIIPMNQLNVYHGDLKSSNMLADKLSNENISVKIIDWGLSFINENMKEIPINVKRPIQFNLPVSVVVFNSSFQGKLSEFISKNSNWTMQNSRIFTAMFLNDYIKTRNNSHLMILLRMIDKFNSLTNILSKQFNENPTNYILNYISEVVYKYTQNGIFNNLEYLNQVYLKNMDVWGFLTTYLDFYDIINDKRKLNSYDRVFLGKIKKIIMETLFLNSITPINIPNLINKLMDLNSSFSKITKNIVGGKKNMINNKNYKMKSIRKKYNKTRKNKTRKNKTRKNYN